MLGRVDRQLSERIGEHGHVIGGGPGPGVARSQHPGQRFTGGVEIGQQRMEPEPALPRRRRLLLVRMGADERGVICLTSRVVRPERFELPTF